MKRTLAYTLSLMAILVAFSACKKYEEGPTVSFRSKKARVIGEWKVTELSENNQSILDADNRTEYDFKDDSYIYRSIGGVITVSYVGDWEFSERNDDIVLSYTDGSLTYSQSWEIIRLAHDEMILEQTEDGTVKRMVMVPR